MHPIFPKEEEGEKSKPHKDEPNPDDLEADREETLEVDVPDGEVFITEVDATKPDDDKLSYRLGGKDASEFNLDEGVNMLQSIFCCVCC